MEAGGSLRRQSSLVADSLRGAPSHLVDPATGPNRGGQNWGNSVIESGEIPLILVRASRGGGRPTPGGLRPGSAHRPGRAGGPPVLLPVPQAQGPKRCCPATTSPPWPPGSETS